MGEQVPVAFVTDPFTRDAPGVLGVAETPPMSPGGVTFAVTATALKAPRVLVVDDNRDAALSLALLLRLSGNETNTAFDGEEALTIASDFDPDLILLDIGLPKLNGYEVCRLLRLRPSTRPVVIVALTGWGEAEDRRKSAVAGFDAHFVKPLEPGALHTILTRLGPSFVV